MPYSIIERAGKHITNDSAYEGTTLKLGEQFVSERSRRKIVKEGV